MALGSVRRPLHQDTAAAEEATPFGSEAGRDRDFGLGDFRAEQLGEGLVRM